MDGMPNFQWCLKFCRMIINHFTSSYRRRRWWFAHVLLPGEVWIGVMGNSNKQYQFYSIDEFQSRFRKERTTFEILVREVVGTEVLPVGNTFGRQVIGARKQVSIFLWCIANQETTRLIADRFKVTYSSVSRVVRRVTESVLALWNQYTFIGQMVKLLLLLSLSSKKDPFACSKWKPHVGHWKMKEDAIFSSEIAYFYPGAWH